MIRDGNVYYLVENDENKTGPYCMTCWDSDKKLINLLVTKTRNSKTIKCGRCSRLINGE